MVCPRVYPYGGIEKFVKTLSVEISNRGYGVEVFGTDPSLEGQTQTRSIEGIKTTVFKSYAPAETMYVSPALISAIRQSRSSIVHAHGYRAITTLESALAVDEKKRFVVTTHLGFSKLGRWVYKLYNPTLGRTVLAKASRIVIVSPVEVMELPILSDYASKVDYIPIGLKMPLPPYDQAKHTSSRLELLYVGRIEENKGIPSLLELAGALDGRRFCLNIVGAGPYESELMSRLGQAAFDNVRYLGHLTEQELSDVYRRASIFILLSKYEGHSVALTEAMSFGLVPIASDVGGNAFVVPKEAGFLVPYPVNIDDLAAILNRLYRSREEIVRMAANGRKRVERLFDLKDVIDRHVKLYEELRDGNSIQ